MGERFPALPSWAKSRAGCGTNWPKLQSDPILRLRPKFDEIGIEFCFSRISRVEFGRQILKQFREPFSVQRGISNRRRDGAMPEIPLDDPNIGSFVNQSVTATMPQHVWMNLKMVKAGCLSHLIDQ